MEQSVKLYSLVYTDAKTYKYATLFVLGNILLPQLCHLIPNGGSLLLPIYFFTLIAAYKYGWRAGLLTALASPIVNSILFGMPVAGMLPVICIKSALLALFAGSMAERSQRVTITALAIVVLAYQALGLPAEWLVTGDISLTMQNFCFGIPGMLLQIFGGYFFINKIIYK